MKKLVAVLCLLALAGCAAVVIAATVGVTTTATANFKDTAGKAMAPVTTSVIVNVTYDPRIVIVGSVSNASPIPGESITYTFRVSNTGYETAKDVSLALAIPAELEFVTGSLTVDGVVKTPVGMTVSIGDLGIGAECLVVYRARVK